MWVMNNAYRASDFRFESSDLVESCPRDDLDLGSVKV